MALALFVLGLVVIKKLSSPSHMEKRISAMVGPDYVVDIGASSYNPIRGTFTAEYIAIEPDTARRTEPFRRMWNFTATSVRAEDVSCLELFRKCFDARRVHFDTPRLRIQLDRRIAASKPIKVSTLPHDELRQAENPVRIDHVDITDGEIIYSECAVDGSRPGSFVFGDLSATITNVTNDTTQMDEPCTMDIRARLAGSGQLNAAFEYNLATRALDLDFRGSVGRMDVMSLNDLLVNLEGIYITSGVIDTTWFDFKVDEDVAKGTVTCLYRGLQFEIISKDSHKQGLGNALATIMSGHESNESNPKDNDSAPVVATVVRRRDPTVPIIKFVWETVRAGLLMTLGVAD
ncbi:MAG TPA: DUF748 domain-containing protein [Candidatus Krumholzibacteria bacterium]|nr:DUF748 domain-containing protein [Candidatus Krumholzibacteria bacterium]